MNDFKKALCDICGVEMPKGEEMFKFHGYSGNCPKPPMASGVTEQMLGNEPTNPTNQPIEEKYRAMIENSGWHEHLKNLGNRSYEEFIGANIRFIENLLEQERQRMSEEVKESCSCSSHVDGCSGKTYIDTVISIINK